MTPATTLRQCAVLSPAGLLILACAWLNLTGWGLSFLGQLNRTGYTVSLLLAAGLWIAWHKRSGTPLIPHWRVSRLRGRFRRGWPLAFLILAGMVWLGGLLHPPTNYDALAYRVPRMLHWLAEERWHWIHTEFHRLNTRTAGFEWATNPLLAFLSTDRWFFLPNAVGFLLLPGLCFSVLWRLGVSPRVAWRWMWLLPSGYCYAIQAGGIGNDLFGALFALAAVDYALRAGRSGHIHEVWLAVLAAALMTSAKASNLPLLLPCALALLPCGRLLLARPFATALVALFAAAASFLPTAALNFKHTGDWTGLKAEPAGLLGGDPLFHLAVNSVLIIEQNFAPTVFPIASQWNHFMERVLPAGLSEKLQRRFEPAAAGLKLPEMQMEQGAGLGCGLSALLLLTALWRLRRGVKWSWVAWTTRARTVQFLVPLGAWIGAAYFMSQSGLSPAARYLTPFYVLLVVPLLAGGDCTPLVRRRGWQFVALAAVFSTALLLTVTQARPLWPALTVLRALDAEHSTQPLLRRAWKVYSIYKARADAFQPARARLPAEADPLGFVSFDDPETSLWRPFGSRRILHLTRQETGADLRRRGIKYVLAKPVVIAQHWGSPVDVWLRQVEGEPVARFPLQLRGNVEAAEWLLVRIRPEPPAG